MSKRSAVVALLLVVASVGLVLASPPDQPRMNAARADLQKARAQLVAAEHNKGGHRAKALSLVNQAIVAVQRGIQFDRMNNHAQLATNVERSSVPFDQPHMRQALEHLKDARNNLEAATADKGGYRVRAIQLINEAIEQVNLGIVAGS
jgi:hypothetical protein